MFFMHGGKTRPRAARCAVFCTLLAAMVLATSCGPLRAFGGNQVEEEGMRPAFSAFDGEMETGWATNGAGASGAGRTGDVASGTAKGGERAQDGLSTDNRAQAKSATGKKQGAGEKVGTGKKQGTGKQGKGEGKASSAARKEAEVLEGLIRDYIGTMSLEDKVSGLFILTPEALTGYSAVTEAGDATREALRAYPVAGLIYFSGNIESRAQLQDMLSRTNAWGSISLPPADEGRTMSRKDGQKAADGIRIPPFLAVDEEGGRVARVGSSAIEVPLVGSMGSLAVEGDPEASAEAARGAGETIGAYLRELGFNLDLAPDADVLVDPQNETIGDRSFGTDPALCGQMVRAYVEGLHAGHIASCIKHFPGLGDTETDTHTGGATSDRTREDYRGAEFLSFRGGMEASTDLVMVSHLTNEAATGTDLPASLNKVMITDILRGDLAYQGIVITDSLQMAAVSGRFDSAQAAVLALEAGADILLMPADFQAARQGILEAVREGRLSESRIDASLCRILAGRAGVR